MAKKTVSNVYFHVGLITLILLVAIVAPGSVYQRSRSVARTTAPAVKLSSISSNKVGPVRAALSLSNPPLAPANARVVRVVNASVLPGQNVVVSVQLDSQGDENALGFSITFDSSKLT